MKIIFDIKSKIPKIIPSGDAITAEDIFSLQEKITDQEIDMFIPSLKEEESNNESSFKAFFRKLFFNEKSCA